MKKLFLSGAIALLLLSVCVLLVGRQRQNDATSQLKTEENDMDAIIAALPPDLPPEIQSYFRTINNDIRQAKEDGDEQWAAELEKDLAEGLQEILNPIELPEEEQEWVQYYEDEIRKAKEEGESEESIAVLEEFRNIHLAGIAEDAEAKRLRQEKRARFEAMNHEERTTYYEDEIQEYEEELRIAKEKGDPTDIRWAELLIQGAKSALEWEKGKPERQRFKEELAALHKWVEDQEPIWIETYRPYLHLEVIDGVERIVGVRTPDEVSLPAQKPSLSDFEADPPLPVESSQTVPDRSVVSPSPELLPPSEAQQNSSAAMVSIVKAQTQFKSWRKDVDEAYFDVFLSQYMNPQELDKYFPTAEDRQNLKLRTAQMQKSVVSQVRKIVDDVKGATPDQKRSLARELVTKNFDKDFAQAVLSELEKETE